MQRARGGAALRLLRARSLRARLMGQLELFEDELGHRRWHHDELADERVWRIQQLSRFEAAIN